MTVEHYAVVHNEVPAWPAAPAAILILAGLDADRVISDVEA